MVKSGNFDPSLQRCLEADRKTGRHRMPSFQYGHPGPMNQPVIHHQWFSSDDGGNIRGGFNGSYDNFSMKPTFHSVVVNCNAVICVQRHRSSVSIGLRTKKDRGYFRMC